ncbi:hypothetical protein ANANG_G00058590 [Anguilla anguilla]|uniref:Zinc finger and BTB domain containing 4 n=2 Tax=Anguilla anguilla TaxID=7936 RepID=A0A9D3MNF9_ANGAN|nr:hypothetical protein ANANG_G00058590 [Anguilla anguilla]
MVSQAEVWDPFHAGTLLSQLNEQRLAGPAPFCDITLIASDDAKFRAHQSILAASSPYFRELLSSPPPAPSLSPSKSALPRKDRVLELPQLQSRVLSDLLEYIYTSRVPQHSSKGTQQLSEAGRSLGVPFLAGLEEKDLSLFKSKIGQDKTDRMEGTDKVGIAKSSKTYFSVPLSVPFPDLSAQNHAPTSHSPSSSACITDPKETSWKLATKVDKKIQHMPGHSPTSSASPIDLTAPTKKDPPSASPSSVTGTVPQFMNLPLLPAHRTGLVFPAGGKCDSFPAGMDSECSTTETAQILFNLSAMAFQGQGALEPDRIDRGSGVKQGRTESPSTGPSLTQPNPLPLPLTPPPPKDSLSVSSEPELLCGVCHRLFSSASSLTVHMRLHRGGRALSCRHCGKAFIHNKRLQSHEAVCRHASPALHAPTKQEPQEDIEENDQGGGQEGQPEQGRIGPGRPLKKGRPFLGRHHRPFPRADLLAEEDHFVKVVDGHIIYFCTVCERSYMTLSSLKRHSNVHSWRRKYPCHFCDKVFALAEYRTKHEVWHTGERRYQCIFCWEAFATYYNLKTHQKAFHGISPGLISSEKTANGGYKQKVNALKLYRLLPMRSQKRPYKTYSQSLTESLLLPPESAKPLSLPLDCSLPTPLGPSQLQSLINDSHPTDLLADPSKFTFGVNSDSIGLGEPSKLTDAKSEGHLRITKEEVTDEEQAGSSGGGILPGSRNIQLSRDYCGSKAPVSSVITYGHPKPSVIKHGTAISSSVIVHSNQISSGGDRNFLNSNSTSGNSQLPSKAAHRPMKKQVLKNYVQSQKEGEGVSTAEEEGDKEVVAGEEKSKPQKGRRAHNKGVTYTAKPACVAGVAEIRGSAPLCQITVRIGEEAIVKRSISETDLMRDKSLSPSKAKKTDASSQDPTEHYHTHAHHHRHRHRLHRSASEQEEGEPGRKSPKAPKIAKVREYYFRQEVREEESDQDAEDNLWRPYYSYKPKRKSLHVQKVKKSTWQRHLRYKRSLRLIRRTERLTDHSIKEGEEDEEEEEEVEEELVKKEGTERHEESSNTNSGLSVDKQQQDIAEENESQSRIRPTKSLTEANCTSRQEHHQTMKRASECGTCGRWFSTARKRDKHELTHLLEFVCLKCRESFSSQAQLDEHQRTQHVQVDHISSLSQNQPVDTDVDMVMETEVEKAVPGKGSPGRVGRRPSVRHICPHCGKVCKTAAALGRHTKRHEVDSPSVDGEHECGAIAPVIEALSTASAEPSSSIESKAKNDHAQAIPVINYPKVAPLPFDNIESQDPNFSREGKAEPQTLGPFGDSEHKDKGPTSASNASPQYNELPQTSPSSRLDRLEASSTSLHSVLVLSRKDILDPTCSYKISRERSAEGQINCKSSPVQMEEVKDTSVCGTMRLHGRANVEIAGPLTSGGEDSQRGVTADSKTEGTPSRVPMRLPAELEEPRVAQNLRLPAISRSSNTVHAQDLTVASIIRERELSHSAKGKVKVQKEQQRDRETTLLVPKQEVETPAPSPEYSIIHSPASTVSQRHSKSPHRSPNASDLLARAHLEAPSSLHSSRGSERQGLHLPSCSSGVNENASTNTLLHSRLPQSETEPDEAPSSATTGSCGEAKYPVQEFPLPLIMPGGCRSSKKHEDNILVSYPTNPLPFGPLGKMGANGDLSKLPFYPDPYHLLYSPQLLAYPYNLAALPMALNMMAPEEKVEPLPFLPALFNYAAGPYAGMVPHHVMANPSHYSNSSGNNKKRDSTNP